jgi:t-SNARE complex subunit (syntaxin)
MRATTHKFLEDYKSSVVATLEMKLLEASIKFQKLSEECARGQYKSDEKPDSNGEQRAPDLNRPHFIEQSQEDLMEEVARSEYKSIEKSIHKISDMYKETASMVRMHEFIIDSIESDVNATEGQVEGGRKHLIDAHRRESRNRPFILKVFAMLYIVAGVYIVLLS